jgi:predicted alpha/beta superfamily hydrolase
MKSKTLLLSFLIGLCCLTGFSQAIYTKVKSTVLNGERSIKVLPPRNYGVNPDQVYPLILVLDGDYLFEPVAGMVDYLSYWDQMPESIVVGINMLQSRYEETSIDENTGLPKEEGLKFMDFVMEVKQKMEKDYRVAPFTVMVGKDLTANFSSFYLMRDLIPIEAFIHIKPEYTETIEANLMSKLQRRRKINFFYVGTTGKDDSMDEYIINQVDTTGVGGIRTNIKLEKFKGTNDYSVAGNAIPAGLQFIFKTYALIDDETIEEFVAEGAETVEEKESQESTETLELTPVTEQESTAEEVQEGEIAEEIVEEEPKKRSEQLNAVNKLLEKQKLIFKTYGFMQPHRLVDIDKMAQLLIEREDWDALIDLGQFADRELPEICYGEYLQGVGYEMLGRNYRAIKSYEKAYALKPAAGITTDMLLDRIAILKEKKD